MLTKHRVTFIRPISNPRDAAGQIPHEVVRLDIAPIMSFGAESKPAAACRRLGKLLRDQGVLPAGVRVRQTHWEGCKLLVFTLITGLHCVTIDTEETYEPTFADKYRALCDARIEAAK